MNLLLIAPLYDNKNKVRYFLGAQIDINGLIEHGSGLQSFARLLEEDRAAASKSNHKASQTPMAALADLGRLLNEGEMRVINDAGLDENVTQNRSTGSDSQDDRRRRISRHDIDNGQFWPAAKLGPNGRLPGVFQNVRRTPLSL